MSFRSEIADHLRAFNVDLGPILREFSHVALLLDLLFVLASLFVLQFLFYLHCFIGILISDCFCQ